MVILDHRHRDKFSSNRKEAHGERVAEEKKDGVKFHEATQQGHQVGFANRRKVNTHDN